MVDIKELTKAGYTDEKLKAIFTMLPGKMKDKHPKASDLLKTDQSRIDDGIARTLDRARDFWAIDRAYDISSEQITYSYARGLISNGATSKQDVLRLAKDFNLDKMLVKRVNSEGKFLNFENRPCSESDAAQDIHLPTFFTIYVPIVASYLKARWAKLFNDRNTVPLYKLEPYVLSLNSKLKARMITSRLSRMSTDMGYPAVERQSIHNALLYGICINFPEQEWLKEEHTIDGKKTITKSGVPFVIPHPARVFYDMTQPLSSLNSDSGVSYAGYWTTQRFKDVHDNKEFWNRDVIQVNTNGKNPWQESSQFRLYQELYPCAAKFPQFAANGSKNDREDKAFHYNHSEHSDSAVNLTVMFRKLNPKDYELFDYDGPVWFRFVYAGNTVVHVKPWAYCPAIVYQYDADGNRANPSGIGQELLPYQDHMGNLLSQYLLSIKKNLIRIVMHDSDIVSNESLKLVRNESENALRGLQFIPVDSRELRNMGVNDAREGLKALNFPPQNTQEILSAVTALLSMVERALGFSPQEIGAAASHQQSATEVVTINNNTSQRLQLTGSYIDEAMNARAKMLYEATIMYDSDEVFVSVADVTDKGRDLLKEMGFKIVEDGEHTVGVSGSKSALILGNFGVFRDATTRTNEPAVAQLMSGFLDRILSNPAIVQVVGPKFIFDRLNEIAEFFQLPVDFRLPADIKMQPDPKQIEADQKAQADQQQQFQQMVQQIAAQVSQQVVAEAMAKMGQDVSQGIAAPLAQKQQELEQALAQFMEQSKQAITESASGLQQLAQQTDQTGQAVQQVAGQSVENKQLLDQVVKIVAQLEQVAGGAQVA